MGWGLQGRGPAASHTHSCRHVGARVSVETTYGPCVCVCHRVRVCVYVVACQGLEDSKACAAELAKALGVSPDDVLLQSTGALTGVDRVDWR